MRVLIIALLMLSFSSFAQTSDKRGTIKVKKVESDTSICLMPEEMPNFPGGSMALSRYISSNMIYPEIAKLNGISGMCVITFTVNGDGSITNASVLKGINGCVECDMEALRVIMLMPRWSPGINKGKSVRVRYNLPIKFNLK